MNPFKIFKQTLLFYISEQTLKDLEKRWSEKTRFYHNTSHLIQIIHDIETHVLFNELHVIEKIALLLAAFMHDVIYDPKKKDNEDQSIAYFKHSYKNHDTIMPEEVIKLIEVTKHRKRPIKKLEKIFWDADNAGFKKGYDVLLSNETKIRKEYAYVPSKEYRENRIKFLNSCIGLFDQKVDKDIKRLIEHIKITYK